MTGKFQVFSRKDDKTGRSAHNNGYENLTFILCRTKFGEDLGKNRARVRRYRNRACQRAVRRGRGDAGGAHAHVFGENAR